VTAARLTSFGWQEIRCEIFSVSTRTAGFNPCAFGGGDLEAGSADEWTLSSRASPYRGGIKTPPRRPLVAAALPLMGLVHGVIRRGPSRKVVAAGGSHPGLALFVL